MQRDLQRRPRHPVRRAPGKRAVHPLTARRRPCEGALCNTGPTRANRNAVGQERLPSRRTRRISPRLRRALRLRDDGCRFPGCTNRLTDAHHVVAWIDGGATTLRNLLSLCRRHHRFVHEHGYRVITGSHGEPRFFRITIDARTAFPRWDGTPLDAQLAVQALLTATEGETTHDS